MTFETSGKFLQGLAGDFLVHIESAQKCLDTKTSITGASGAGAIKGSIIPIDDDVVIAPGGLVAGIDGFIVAGPPVADAATATGSPADPYTVINDFTGAVLNESALVAAGYSADLAGIKAAAALAGVKWVAEPVPTTEQKGGTPTT